MHDLSDYYLFSVHMVQHLLLTLVFPPLLICWECRDGCSARCSAAGGAPRWRAC